MAKRAARLAQRGRLVRLSAAVFGEPQSTRAWAMGAVGEERVAARLHAAADRGVLALHDRRIPGSRANIDHIAIGPAGVCVIDAKRYENAQIRVRRVGGLFTRRRDELLVRGRVRNDLVVGLAKQVSAVCAALEVVGRGDVPVIGVLCFVDGRFPLSSRRVFASASGSWSHPGSSRRSSPCRGRSPRTSATSCTAPSANGCPA